MDDIKRAIASLKGFQNTIGIMGGEPTLHPDFKAICKLVQDEIPQYRTGLWTAGYKWKELKPLVTRTFGEILYNDHSDPRQRHQPILVAIDEVIQDKTLMWDLIEKCALQEHWSPSITPKGGFFCEVAAAMDMAFGGPGGYPIEPGWWKREPADFRDQINRYCPMCSGALPMLRPPRDDSKDLVSKGNYERLMAAGSPKAMSQHVEIISGFLDEDVKKYKGEWRPWQYLGGIASRKKDLQLDELWLLQGFHGLRKRYLKLKWQMTHLASKSP